MRIVRLFGLLVAVPLAAVAPNSAPPSCNETPRYRALDFWVGDWHVYVDDELVGHNRIEKILDGCAVMEHWTDRNGEVRQLIEVSTDGGASWRATFDAVYKPG